MLPSQSQEAGEVFSSLLTNLHAILSSEVQWPVADKCLFLSNMLDHHKIVRPTSPDLLHYL
jgi:regulator of sirC expression with transglutaminase-like and TPR domain